MTMDSTDINRRNRNRSWWKQRTSLERKGIIFLVIALLVIIALIIALAIIAHKYTKKSEDKICNTSGCVQAAAGILNNIDESVDPCDDFYEFACGSFIQKSIIPDDKTEVGSVQNLADTAQLQFKTIFEESSSPGEPRAFGLVRQFYETCMNTEAIEEDGLTPWKELIKDLGGWPLLEGDTWDENSFDWKKSAYKFRKHGLNSDNFINLDVDFDMKNSSRLILELDQPELDVGRDNLLGGFDDEVVTSVYNFMVDLAEMFGIQRVKAEYEAKLVMEFKMQIANISVADSDRRDKPSLYNPMTIYELQKAYGSVYWLEYIRNLLDLPDLEVNNEQVVTVTSPPYISKFAYLLSTTPKRVQANYVIFQALYSREQYLPEAIRDRVQQLKKVVSGNSKRSPRWDECVSATSEAFELAAGAMFARRYSQEETKQIATEMVSDIRKAFIKILKQADWMDESTRQKAVEKASVIHSHIAYPDEFKDDKILDDYYSELVLVSGNCIETVKNVTVFNKNKMLRLLPHAMNKTDWRTRYNPTEVNAVYSPQENSIQLPAIVLQGVVFDKDRLRSMNYGNMGFFIGHEITHGFDNQGKQFDKDGNFHDWWAEKTNEAFLKKTECIINQYSNYTVTEIKTNVDGELTQGENIADNGGVKEAYLAYTEWVERNGQEPSLPGLKYSPQQLFWISAANCWCSKERPEALQVSILDEHSPNKFRVIGAFSNSKYFSEDFKCPLGSKMNPKQKCSIW